MASFCTCGCVCAWFCPSRVGLWSRPVPAASHGLHNIQATNKRCFGNPPRNGCTHLFMYIPARDEQQPPPVRILSSSLRGLCLSAREYAIWNDRGYDVPAAVGNGRGGGGNASGQSGPKGVPETEEAYVEDRRGRSREPLATRELFFQAMVLSAASTSRCRFCA